MTELWEHYNPNPNGRNVGDCVVRAIGKALDQTWEVTYTELVAMGYMLGDMPSSNHVWGAYLRRKGYVRQIPPERDVYTVIDFCKDHPTGTYILAIPGHVVCVQEGKYYDSWDSGKEIPVYFWRKNGTPSNMDKNRT